MRGRRGGLSETMEAWEARMSEAAFQAVSMAEQSYITKSTFDSIDFSSSLTVLFKRPTLFCWIRVWSLRVSLEMRGSGGG